MEYSFRTNAWLIVLFTLCCLVNTLAASDNLTWEDRSFGLLDLDLKTIDVDYSGKRILTASSHALYLSENLGESWNLVFRFSPAQEQLVNHEDESADLDDEIDFDPSDFDVEDLYEAGILEEGQEIDDIGEDELKRSLQEAGMLEGSDDQDLLRQSKREQAADLVQLSQGIIYSVTWDPVDAKYSYLATDQGVYVSDNWGKNWAPISGNRYLSNQNVTRIAALSSPGFLIVEAGSNLYYSSDFGTTFTGMNFSELKGTITDFELDLNRRRVLFSTSDSQIYTVDVRQQLTKFGSYQVDKDRTLLQITGSSVGNFMVSDGERIYYQQIDGSWTVLPGQSLVAARLNDMYLAKEYLSVATDRGVYLWNRIKLKGRFVNRGLLDLEVRDITGNPVDGKQIWIATSTGVYRLAEYDGKTDRIASRVIPAGLPDFDVVLSAALSYADLKSIHAVKVSEAMDRYGYFPLVEFLLQYDDIGLEAYFGYDVVAISSGNPYIGPVDEVYGFSDENYWDVALGMRWYPQDLGFNNASLKIRRQIARDVTRRNKLIEKVTTLYRSLLQELHLNHLGLSVKSKLRSMIKIEQLTAELDALTGFELKFLENTIETNRYTDEGED